MTHTPAPLSYASERHLPLIGQGQGLQREAKEKIEKVSLNVFSFLSFFKNLRQNGMPTVNLINSLESINPSMGWIVEGKAHTL